MKHLHGVEDVLTATQGLELSCTHGSRVSVRVSKPQPVLIPLRRISARAQVAAERVEGTFTGSSRPHGTPHAGRPSILLTGPVSTPLCCSLHK